MKPSLLGHDKFDHLRELLGVAVPHAIGILELLWLHTARQQDGDDALTGLLPGMDARKLARVARWTEDPDTLLNALVTAGFVDRLPDGTLAVHNWHKHRPAYLNDRARKRKQPTTDDADIPGTSRKLREVPGESNPSPPLPSLRRKEDPPVTAGAVTSPSDAGASPGEGAVDGRGRLCPPGFRFSEDGAEMRTPTGVKAHAKPARSWPTRQADIDAIYQAYPRHKEPRRARQSIEKAVRRLALRGVHGDHRGAAAWLLQRTQRFAASLAAQDTQWTKHPATWFNGDCFDEDPASWDVPRGTHAGGGVEARAGPSPMQRTAERVAEERRRRREGAPERAVDNGQSATGEGQHRRA